MSEFDSDEVLMEAEEAMEKARDNFGTSLSRVRAGRASPSLLDHFR